MLAIPSDVITLLEQLKIDEVYPGSPKQYYRDIDKSFQTTENNEASSVQCDILGILILAFRCAVGTASSPIFGGEKKKPTF